MTTVEAILLFLLLMCLLEFIRAIRAWYEAEAKSYELSIIKERKRRYKSKEQSKKCL